MNEAAELLETLNKREQEINALTRLWQSLLPQCPDAYQFRTWLRLHTFENIVYAIKETDRKYHGLNGAMDLDFMIRFASKVANRLKAAAHPADTGNAKVA